MSTKTKMEQTIQTLKGDNQELMKENASLKRQIGGFKTSNDRYKKQAKNEALYVKSLQEEIAKYKKDAERMATDLTNSEAISNQRLELNKVNVDKINEREKIIKEKERVIAGLQSQIAELNKRIANNVKNIQDLTGERDVAIANYDYVCGLPWYKRIFYKK